MTSSELRELLHRAELSSQGPCFEGLSQRKQRELQFHDADRERLAEVGDENRELSAPNRKYYTVTRKVSQYVNEWVLEHARDGVFLDYACGEGKAAILASTVAQLSIGIDISPRSLKLARALADASGAGNRVVFVQADCERTGLPDSSVDVILCSGMLHHLDLSYAVPELRRLLKPGGRVLAFEALNYNPIFALYRHLTPKLRTEFEKEHILSLSDIDFMRRFFVVNDIRYWNLATLLATPFRHFSVFDSVLRALESVDDWLLRIPGFAQMAWIFTFELQKNAES